MTHGATNLRCHSERSEGSPLLSECLRFLTSFGMTESLRGLKYVDMPGTGAFETTSSYAS